MAFSDAMAGLFRVPHPSTWTTGMTHGFHRQIKTGVTISFATARIGRRV
jgi:hypothetical protein